MSDGPKYAEAPVLTEEEDASLDDIWDGLAEKIKAKAEKDKAKADKPKK